jgi:hypothetical protein
MSHHGGTQHYAAVITYRSSVHKREDILIATVIPKDIEQHIPHTYAYFSCCCHIYKSHITVSSICCTVQDHKILLQVLQKEVLPDQDNITRPSVELTYFLCAARVALRWKNTFMFMVLLEFSKHRKYKYEIETSTKPYFYIHTATSLVRRVTH